MARIFSLQVLLFAIRFNDPCALDVFFSFGDCIDCSELSTFANEELSFTNLLDLKQKEAARKSEDR